MPEFIYVVVNYNENYDPVYAVYSSCELACQVAEQLNKEHIDNSYGVEQHELRI